MQKTSPHTATSTNGGGRLLRRAAERESYVAVSAARDRERDINHYDHAIFGHTWQQL